MKIVAADIYDIDLHPWKPPIILRLITDEGLYGLGEFPLCYGSGRRGALGLLEESPYGLARLSPLVHGDILLLFNSTPDPVEFKIPKAVEGRGWRTFINTGNESPHDVYPDGDGPLLPTSGKVKLTYRSMCCFVAE